MAWRRLQRRWRRWSPWWLRHHLDVLAADFDQHNTDGQQNYRYVQAVLIGHPEPNAYATRFHIENGGLTLHIGIGPRLED